MITEDYVSFEVAKLLKEKGFDGVLPFIYVDTEKSDREVHLTDTLCNYNDGHIKDVISAPTHQLAMKWLRKKGFHINASISYDYSEEADGNTAVKWTFWLFEIFSSFSGNLIYTEEVNKYDSYEEAVEAALKYSLENLI